MPRARRRVTTALVLSLGLHAGLAALFGSNGGGGMDAAGGSAFAAQLTARLAEASPVVAAPPAAESASSVVAPTTRESEHRRPDAMPETAARRGAAIGIEGTHYFKSSELQQRPEPIGVVAFDGRGEEAMRGYLVLRLLINESGTVDDVKVVVDDAKPDLLENARAAFSKARYRPGMRGGYAVKSELLVEVKLDPIVIPAARAQY